MSILLHDISFPPEGEDGIGLFLRWDGTVQLWRPNAFVGHDVEATELPPHGRLIDADALCNRLEKAGKIKPYLESGLNVAISFALTAPTIIPAEIISENEIKIIDTKGKSNYDPKRRFVISAEEET